MIKFIICFAGVCMLISADVDVPRTTVTISSGPVKGYVSKSSTGKIYYGFNGIPYANPPIRFKAPEPVTPWTETIDATKDGHVCPQVHPTTNVYEGNEDCLTINVYSPQLENNLDDLMPVIVTIHGGGFFMGNGGNATHGPELLMNYPVVVVTFNYRLGIFGFLNTEDEHAYGNYGMLDQVLALKWVQSNIVKFGGDPRRVTLLGGSAGGASAIYHMLSPLSTGLFHKAIAGSGTPLNPWAFKQNPKEWTKMFAEQVKCPNTENSKDIVKCLSEKPAEELVLQSRLIRKAIFFPNDLVPSVESKNGPGFLTAEPRLLLEEGKIANKVPIILGFPIDVGHSVYLMLAHTLKLKGKEYFEKEFPSHLTLYSTIKPNMTLAIKAIVNEYVKKFQGNLEDKESFEKLLFTIIGDSFFSSDITRTAELLSKAGVPTYAYIYNHLGKHCVARMFGGICGRYSSRGDDKMLNFRFGNYWPLSTTDSKMASIMNTLWTSFANESNILTINNDEDWPNYNSNAPQYLELSLTPTIKRGPLFDKMKLWTETLPTLIHKSGN
ncbi:Carboxylesterase 5A [Chamberlinius hualienensis]